MRPKQTEAFLHSPPPESFFSRTFKKPGQKASTQESPPSEPQPQREGHMQLRDPEGIQPTEKLPQLRSIQPQAQAGMNLSRKDNTNEEMRASGSQSEHDLSSNQEIFSGFLGGSSRNAGAEDQVRGSQGADSGVIENGVAIRPRHERVASLNAWSQEASPNIGRRGSQQETDRAASSQGETIHADGKSQKQGKVGFGYQNADAAGSFDFRLPPAPDQKPADQSR